MIGIDVEKSAVRDVHEQAEMTEKIGSEQWCSDVCDDELPSESFSGNLDADGAGTVGGDGTAIRGYEFNGIGRMVALSVLRCGGEN